MAAQFDSAPSETYVPNGQTLMYTISDDGGAVSASHRFIVQIYESTTEIGKIYLTANANHKAFFDLSTFVKDRIHQDILKSNSDTLTLFDMASKIDHSTSATNKFQVKIGTYNGTSESLAEATKVIYLVNGTEQILAGLHPAFTAYYPTGTSMKGWLTERWDNKEVSGEGINSAVDYYFGQEDEGCIAWIHDDTVISGDDERVYYQLYNDAGALGSLDFHRIASDGGIALNSTDYDEKIHYTGLAPASLKFTSTNLPDHANNTSWTYYLLWLADNSANRKSKYIRVYKDCGISKNERVQIAYANSLGGWDYINFTGNTGKTESVEKKNYNKTLGKYSGTSYTFSPAARTTKPYHTTATTTYNLKASGFDREQYAQVQSMLRSHHVMMRLGDSNSDWRYQKDREKWLPVNVDSKSVVIRDSMQSKIFDIAIDVSLAQDIRC